jgi:hypothetical protein
MPKKMTMKTFCHEWGVDLDDQQDRNGATTFWWNECAHATRYIFPMMARRLVYYL